jgi:hypothetical protein
MARVKSGVCTVKAVSLDSGFEILSTFGKGSITVGRVLSDNFHDTGNAWHFGIRVIEKCQIAFTHGSHVIPCYCFS